MFFKRNYTKKSYKNKKNFSTLYIWLLSYLVICIIFAICSILIYSSLIKTTQNYVSEVYVHSLNEIVTNVDYNFEYAAKCHSTISHNSNLAELMYNSGNLSQKERDSIALSLGSELKKTLPLANFSGMYVFLNSLDYVVSNTQINDSAEFFANFYAGSNISYSDWISYLKRPNLANYISVKTKNGSYIELMYQLPVYMANTVANATLVLRIDDSIFNDQFNSEHISGKVVVLDKLNNDLALSSDYKYDDFPNRGIITQDDYIIVVQTSAYTRWKYLYIINNSSLYKKIYQTKYTHITLIMLSLFICCGLGIVFSLRNYHPLNDIIKTYRHQNSNSEDYQPDYKLIKSALRDYVESKQQLNKLEVRAQSSRMSLYLSELLDGHASVGSDENLPVRFPSNIFSVISFKPANNENLFDDDSLTPDEIDKTTFFILQNIFEEILNKSGTFRIINHRGAIVGIYCYKDETSSLIYKESLYKDIADGLSFIKINFSFDCIVGISAAVKGDTGLESAYNEALIATSFPDASADNIVFYDDVRKYSLKTAKSLYDSLNVKTENLTSCILNKDSATAVRIIENIFTQSIKSLDIEKVKIISFSLENSMLSTVDLSDIDSFDNKRINKIVSSINYGNIPESYEALKKLTECLCSLNVEIAANAPAPAVQSNSAADILPQVIDYIKENYTNPLLDITNIGTHFSLSGYYISKMFKSVTNESIAAFIANLRIEQSKQYLENTDWSIAEIYQKCGFTNEKTFSRTFSKREGVTPTQYRKIIRNV